MKTIYLCGPITGLTYEEATRHRKEVKDYFADLFVEVLTPMRGKSFVIGDGETFQARGYEIAMTSDKGIVGRDRNDVMNCSAMIADFRFATQVSIGSCVEFGWADAWRKPIITVLPDSPHHPHDHAFIHHMSTYVVYDMEEALELTSLLLNL